MLTHRLAPERGHGVRLGARFSGCVLGGAWDEPQRLYKATIKYKACALHFIDGVSWQDTGIYDHLLKRIAAGEKIDKCENRADIEARYARLDDLWNIVMQTGALPKSATHVSKARDGILIHIDRDGCPIFANQGFHRLAIAQLAKIPTIGVVLGLTHHDAVINRRYRAFRDAHSVARSG